MGLSAKTLDKRQQTYNRLIDTLKELGGIRPSHAMEIDSIIDCIDNTGVIPAGIHPGARHMLVLCARLGLAEMITRQELSKTEAEN